MIITIFGGIISIRYKVIIYNLIRMDSVIDIIFWISTAISTWIVRSAIFKANYKFILSDYFGNNMFFD
ncbi:hypothetical protein Ga0061079_11332 [Apibacter mensalis]|uniref:Uncharacterized protein n=1 Tax=Apibacter mensalis TaxID=1586267 RepID=A0A0X3ASX1_9FLAO|nr:hypothetical protein Ga0061079_11332 [Apibacter mensalis]